ncbi:MAG: peroxiredoxin [Alphaproteobacteria bacterium]|nr:peroxiredoxin [Alphaproteobacteria bacterium]
MAIKQGDKMPEGKFRVMTATGAAELSTDDLFKGKKVALFSVPGAFTPTCSNQHLPSYLKNYDQIRAKGFDTIACMAVNDAFVMDAWGKERGVGDKIKMLADGNGEYTKKLGLELDGSKFGLGMRGKRFSMVVNNGTVETLNVDEGKYELTSAENTCAIR